MATANHMQISPCNWTNSLVHTAAAAAAKCLRPYHGGCCGLPVKATQPAGARAKRPQLDAVASSGSLLEAQQPHAQLGWPYDPPKPQCPLAHSQTNYHTSVPPSPPCHPFPNLTVWSQHQVQPGPRRDLNSGGAIRLQHKNTSRRVPCSCSKSCAVR